ncbi:uncharacterized protein LOC144651254 isoform X2 [Oculina patagonica]
MAGAPKNEDSGFVALHPLYGLTESDIHTRQLPDDIGKRWKDLARELGFKKALIDAIENENDSYKERCFDLLVRWLEKEGEQGATAEKLATALTSIGLQNLADRLIYQSNGRRTICIEIEGTMKLDNAYQTQIMLGRDSAGRKKFFVWESDENEFRTSIEDLKNYVNATIEISVKTLEETEDMKSPEVKDLTVKEHPISEELERLERKLSNVIKSLEIGDLKEETFEITKKLDLINRHSRTLQELYTKVTGMTGEACKCDEFVRRNFYDFTYHGLRAVHNDLNARVADLQSEEAHMKKEEKDELKRLLSYQMGRKKQVEYLERIWMRLFSTPEAQLTKSRSSPPERETNKPPSDAKYTRSNSEGARPKEIISRKSKNPFSKWKSEDHDSCVLTAFSETKEGN